MDVTVSGEWDFADPENIHIVWLGENSQGAMCLFGL